MPEEEAQKQWLAGVGSGTDLRPQLRLSPVPSDPYGPRLAQLELHAGHYYLGPGQRAQAQLGPGEGEWGPPSCYLFSRPALVSLDSYVSSGPTSPLTVQLVTLTSQPIGLGPVLIEGVRYESGQPVRVPWLQLAQLAQTVSGQVRAEGERVVLYLPYSGPILPSVSTVYGVQVQTLATGPWVSLGTDLTCDHNRLTFGPADAAKYSGLTVTVRYHIDQSYAVQCTEDALATVQMTVQLLWTQPHSSLWLAMDADDPEQLWQYGRGLISNTGFESNLNGWQLVSSGGSTVQRTTTGAWEGTACAQVTGTTQPGDGLYTVCSVSTGQPYTLSAWLWSSQSTGLVAVEYGRYRAVWSPSHQPDRGPGRWQRIELAFLADSSVATIGFRAHRAYSQFRVDKVTVGPGLRSGPDRAYLPLGLDMDPSRTVLPDRAVLCLAEAADQASLEVQRIDLQLHPAIPVRVVGASEMVGPHTPDVQVLLKLWDLHGNPVSGYTQATVTWNGSGLDPVRTGPGTVHASNARGELRYRYVPSTSGLATLIATAGSVTRTSSVWCQPLVATSALGWSNVAGRWAHRGWKLFLSLDPVWLPSGRTGTGSSLYLVQARVTDMAGYPLTVCTQASAASYEPIRPWVTFELYGCQLRGCTRGLGPTTGPAPGRPGSYLRAESWLGPFSGCLLTAGLATCLIELADLDQAWVRAYIEGQIASPVTLYWYSDWLHLAGAQAGR